MRYDEIETEIREAAPELEDEHVYKLCGEANEYHTDTSDQWVMVEEVNDNFALPKRCFYSALRSTAAAWERDQPKAKLIDIPLAEYLESDASLYQALCDESHGDAYVVTPLSSAGDIYNDMLANGLSEQTMCDILEFILDSDTTAIVTLHPDLVGPDSDPVDNADGLAKLLGHLEEAHGEQWELSTDPTDYVCREDRLLTWAWEPEQHPTPRPGVDLIGTVLLEW